MLNNLSEWRNTKSFESKIILYRLFYKILKCLLLWINFQRNSNVSVKGKFGFFRFPPPPKVLEQWLPFDAMMRNQKFEIRLMTEKRLKNKIQCGRSVTQSVTKRWEQKHYFFSISTSSDWESHSYLRFRCGCGTVDLSVASDNKGPLFESRLGQNLSVVWKNVIKNIKWWWTANFKYDCGLLKRWWRLHSDRYVEGSWNRNFLLALKIVWVVSWVFPNFMVNGSMPHSCSPYTSG